MGRLKAGLATCATGHRDIHEGLLLLSRGGLWAGCRLRMVCEQVEGWAGHLHYWSQGHS